MLQWRGGSRRKITTSRKSTQKRQQQYFEQRKRQQQQPAELEGYSYSDKTGCSSRQQENNRSLDILSLLNLSTIRQEARAKVEGDLLTPNYPTEQNPTATQTNTKVFPADPIELEDTRTSSNYHGETVCRKVSFDSPANQAKSFNGKNAKVDQFKIAPDHNLSVLDLLGDDGQNSISVQSLVHEAHAAFSVEGLGKVEMGTPVHSPRQPGRNFSPGCPLPFRTLKRAHSSKHLDVWLDDLETEAGLASKECDMGLLDSICKVPDDLIHDVDIPFDRSSSELLFSSTGVMGPFSDLKQKIPYGRSSPELPLFSRGKVEPFSDPKQTIPFDKEFSQLNYNPSNLKSIFGDEEIFYNCEDRDEYNWNVSSSFFGENLLDEECRLSSKNWPYDLDSTAAGYLSNRNWEKLDFSSESFRMQKRRSNAKVGLRINNSESFAPYAKHKISETYHDIISPDKIWYSAAERTSDVRDATHQPAWSSFLTEDAKDSMSMLSEESCSSSAVWREATRKSPHRAVGRQKMRGHAGGSSSPIKQSSLKNDGYAQEQGNNLDSPVQQQGVDKQAGKCIRMSNSSTSNAAHSSTPPSEEVADIEIENRKLLLIIAETVRRER